MNKTGTTAFIIFMFRLIPLGMRKILFRALATLFYYAWPKQRLIALHNLFRAFPERKAPELIAIAKGTYRHMSIMAAEFFEIPYISKENIHKFVEFQGLENLAAAKARNKGILSIVAHFGNWEMMTAALPAVSDPVQIVYRPLDSPVIENLISWVRTANGNGLIQKDGAVLRIFHQLRRNRAIGLLIDQNMAAREGIFVDFFNRPACTSTALAFLAMRTGAPVLPAFMIRMKDGRYKCLIQPPVELIETGDEEQDIRANTQKFTSIIEDIVRQYPDQYFWVHQRWKTQTCQTE